MELLKRLFTPLTYISGKAFTILAIVNAVIAIILWQIFASGGLIPTPIKIGESIIKIVASIQY
jgi:hypothetical protein